MKELLKEDFSFAEGILQGYTALVCGASKGIGKATAQMLSRAGAKVVLCARSKDELEEVISNLYGDGHTSLVMDLEEMDSIENNIKKLISQVGDIEILINNSGGPPGGPLIENNISDFQGPFKRHLFASHMITKLLIPGMKRSEIGRAHV